MKVNILNLEIDVIEEIDPETMVKIDSRYELREIYFYSSINKNIGYGTIFIEQNENDKTQFILTYNKCTRKNNLEHYLITKKEINKLVKHFGLFEEEVV